MSSGKAKGSRGVARSTGALVASGASGADSSGKARGSRRVAMLLEFESHPAHGRVALGRVGFHAEWVSGTANRMVN